MQYVLSLRSGVVFLLACLSGCASTGLLHFGSNEFPKAGPKNPVVRILGLWQASDGVAGNRATRGFSGQIHFFAGDKLSAQVDGEVMIYVFDDQGPEDEQAKPIHEFRYPAESWNALLGKGPLGATYSVFIPYTRPGFHQAKCSLRIRYTPKQGPPVHSEFVNVVVPGTTKSKPEDETGTGPLPTKDPLAAAAAAAAALREPPRVKGTAEAIPVANSQEPSRPRAAELTDADKQRLISAAKARLEAERNQRVELAGYEEPAGDKPAENSGWKRRRPNILLEEEEGVADGDRSERLAARSLEKPSSKKHILDDESEAEASEFQNPAMPSLDDGVE